MDDQPIKRMVDLEEAAAIRALVAKKTKSKDWAEDLSQHEVEFIVEMERDG